MWRRCGTSAIDKTWRPVRSGTDAAARQGESLRLSAIPTSPWDRLTSLSADEAAAQDALKQGGAFGNGVLERIPRRVLIRLESCETIPRKSDGRLSGLDSTSDDPDHWPFPSSASFHAHNCEWTSDEPGRGWREKGSGAIQVVPLTAFLLPWSSTSRLGGRRSLPSSFRILKNQQFVQRSGCELPRPSALVSRGPEPTAKTSRSSREVSHARSLAARAVGSPAFFNMVHRVQCIIYNNMIPLHLTSLMATRPRR